MDKVFRPWNVDQPFLLPPSLDEFVPEGHLAYFIRDLVRESLDLTPILSAYRGPKGFPPFDPALMTALLLYSYAVGVYSSRKIATACEERFDFFAITGADHPEFRAVAEFRRRHFAALGDLFVQVLQLCKKAGLVKLGHVALDGTKIKANASKHKAMSYGRMREAEKRLRQEIDTWFEKAEAADVEEDAVHGADRCGNELPDWVRSKEQRLAKIRAARLEMEREARETYEKKVATAEAKRVRRPPESHKRPNPKKQVNFTDPESRIMKGRDGFVQGYNAQAAVDAHRQVIVTADVTTNAADSNELLGTLDQLKRNCGRHAKEMSADSGYWSATNHKELKRRRVKGYIAIGRQRHGSKAAVGKLVLHSKEATEMIRRLKRGGHRSRYRLRKTTVEPVFGQIKSARGFQHFSCRGLASAKSEWRLVAAVHNLKKLYGAVGPRNRK